MNARDDMKPRFFRDRREAGRLLAAKVAAYANRPDVVVLALPRGGVPVAYEVARALNAPLDVFLVRKLGVPGYEELAMGAIASGGVRVLNDQLMGGLAIPDYIVDDVPPPPTPRPPPPPICAITPEPFHAIGLWIRRFLTDYGRRSAGTASAQRRGKSRGGKQTQPRQRPKESDTMPSMTDPKLTEALTETLSR